MSSEEENPYDFVEDDGVDRLEGVDDSIVRSRYIREEVRIIAVGWFYYCMAAFQLAMVLGIFLFVDFEQAHMVELGVAILVVLSVLFLVTGYGMRHFLEWARLPSIVAAVVGMFMFPIGTLAGFYCVLLLRKSIVVEIFTPRYRKLLEQENYRSMGWLAFVTGVALAATFWGLFFIFEDFGVDWKLMKRHIPWTE